RRLERPCSEPIFLRRIIAQLSQGTIAPPLGCSETDSRARDCVDLCPAYLRSKRIEEEILMMKRVKSKFLVTTAVLLAGVGFASAQGVSGAGGAGGAS